MLLDRYGIKVKNMLNKDIAQILYIISICKKYTLSYRSAHIYTPCVILILNIFKILSFWLTMVSLTC